MADGVTVDNGSLTDYTASTDEVTIGGLLGHVQRVKLVDGTDGGTDVIAGSAAKGLYVDPHGATVRKQATSAGLTTATTAYTAGDQLGTILSFTNAVRASGGAGSIVSATLLDKAKILGAVDLYLFDQSVTLAADNAAADFSDADNVNCLGILQVPPPKTTASNGLAIVEFSGLGIECAATTLYGALVTRSGHTFFGAVGDIVVSLLIAQD